MTFNNRMWFVVIICALLLNVGPGWVLTANAAEQTKHHKHSKHAHKHHSVAGEKTASVRTTALRHHHSRHHGTHLYLKRHRYKKLYNIVDDALSPRFSAIVIDTNTGNVLYSKNATATRYPASLTKIMTLYMTFEALKAGKIGFDTALAVSSHASNQAPSKLGLRPGQTISVKNAILALVTKSANDAAVTLAENLGGSEEHFAELMTEQARKLGMKNTEYFNASGLPNLRQHTTAEDIAILSLAIYQHFPEYYHFFNTKIFNYQGRDILTHNHLMLSYPGMDGLKTGYIAASGFNLACSAVRGHERLIAVVFGGRTARSRDEKMRNLLNDAFDNKSEAKTLENQTEAQNIMNTPPRLVTANEKKGT